MYLLFISISSLEKHLSSFFFLTNLKLKCLFVAETVFFIYSDVNPLSIYALQIT